MAIILRTATPSDADDIASLLAVSWRAAYGSILTPDELAIVARDWHHPDRLRRQMSDPLVRFVSARVCGHDEARIGDITLALTSMERTVSKLERS